MSVLEIEGGVPLSGEMDVRGSKNAVLPMIAASLLTTDEVVLENIPDIRDVRTMVRIVSALGVETDWQVEQRRLSICAGTVAEHRLPPKACSEMRASILLLAPLLYRMGCAEMSPPGGDVIGVRGVDTHFYGLEKLGAEIQMGRTFFLKLHHALQGNDLFLSEASVTATEQLLMAACAAEGRTIIRNAACEPHVSDLAVLLQKMGADIKGVGSNVLEVQGGKQLQGATHRVVSDHTEAGSFLAIAAATGGNLTVRGIDRPHYWMIRRVFETLGIWIELEGDEARVAQEQQRRVQPTYSGGIPCIDDGVWPHFPSDLMSMAILLATQVHGTVLFFEKLYESRMYFVDRLNTMGANTVVCDPHRVVVCGPSQLYGIELASPDIRAGVALVGAALCASGISTIRNVECIDRGYEDIAERLKHLGARVARHSDQM